MSASDQSNVAAARARLPRPVREQQMLDAGSELFGRLGYHAVSMDQIADEVGVSKPMLYAYFVNKEGLCRACVERAGADAVKALRISWEPDRTPDSLLWAGFTAFFEFVCAHPTSWRLIRSKYSYDEPIFQEMVGNVHQKLLAEIQLLAASTSAENAGNAFGDPATRELAAQAILGAATAIADACLDRGTLGSPEEAATMMMNCFWVGLRDHGEGESFDPLTAF